MLISCAVRDLLQDSAVILHPVINSLPMSSLSGLFEGFVNF